MIIYHVQANQSKEIYLRYLETKIDIYNTYINLLIKMNSYKRCFIE